MSTKTTVFTILAVLGAVLSVFSKALGLALDPAKVLLGVTGILIYVFGSMKTDAAAINQPLVWKDPKVWLAAVQAMLGALTSAGVALPLGLSPELVMAILSAIITALFKPVAVTKALKARRLAMAYGPSDKQGAGEGLPTAGIIVVALAVVGGLVWFISTLTR